MLKPEDVVIEEFHNGAPPNWPLNLPALATPPGDFVFPQLLALPHCIGSIKITHIATGLVIKQDVFESFNIARTIALRALEEKVQAWTK